MISIKLDVDQIEVGGFLTGRVFWSDDRRPRRIIVSACWDTEGSGNPKRGVARAMEVVPRAAEMTVPFRFLIPHEGPITFRTQLTGVVWKIRVRVDQRGFDEFAESAFRVVPRRRERLAPAPEEQGA